MKNEGSLIVCCICILISCSRGLPSATDLDHYREAKSLYLNDDLEGALRLVDEARKSAPGFSGASFLAGKIHFFRKDYAKAEVAWKETIARNPGHVDARKWLCRLYLSGGEQEKARAVLEPALADSSEDAELLVLMGKVLKAKQEYTAALDYFSKALALADRLAEAPLERAEIYRSYGLPSKARTDLDRASGIVGPDSGLYAHIRAVRDKIKEEP
jgi:tetratricopeptide (TPR) repeat protein